jgi:hypothetical protein
LSAAAKPQETAVTGHQLRYVLVFMGGFIVVHVIHHCLSSPNTEYVEIVLLLLALAVIWVTLGSIVVHRRTAGAALLDLHDPSPTLQLWLLLLATMFLLAIGAYLGYLALTVDEPDEMFLDRLLTGVLCVSIAVVLFMSALPVRTRIRRRRRRRSQMHPHGQTI